MYFRGALQWLRELAGRERARLAQVTGDYVASSSTVVPLISIFVVLTILASLGGFMARAYRSEKGNRAARYFESGKRLAAEKHYQEAAERYRAALTLSRDNADYRLALASALVELGRAREAEAHLKDLLQGDPTDGLMNLLMARLLANSKEPVSAETYFNRAIYGYWPDGDTSNRLNARFELVDAFLRTGADRKAVGELMRMQADIPDNPAVAKQLGRLFLRANAPREAAAVFRKVVKGNRGDAEALAGLGEAELKNENFAVARSAFALALRLNPDDKLLRAKYELADETNRLDPTLPRLRASERYARTRTLVKRALAEIESCTAEAKPPENAKLTALLESAREAAKGRQRGQDYSDAADANLLLLETLINAAHQSCGQGYETPGPLALVLARTSVDTAAEPQSGSGQGGNAH